MWLPDLRRPAAPRGAAGPRRKILVVNGHPDPRPERFCAALCAAYAAGADSVGWETRQLNLGGLAFCGAAPGDSGSAPSDLPKDLHDAVETVCWADGLAIVFPLWLDRPPAPLCRLFEHAASRPRRSRTARIVVTMEMPAFAHRSICRDENTSDVARSLSLRDVAADQPTFIGSVHMISPERRAHWLRTLHASGIRG